MPNKSKTILYLMRHASTDGTEKNMLVGSFDMPLNQKGKEEAKALFSKVSKIKYDVLLSSPLKRAISTAKFATGEEPIIEPLAIERNIGEFEGYYDYEVDSIFPYCVHYEFKNHQLHDGNKKGETLKETWQRAEKLLKKIKKNYPGKTVLLVTHSDLIKMLNGIILKMPIKKALPVFIKTSSIRKYEI